MDYFQSGEYTFLWKNLQPFLQTWPADWWSTFSYFLAALSCNFTANPKSTNYKAFCLVTSFRSIFVIEIEVWALSMALLRMNFSIKKLTKPSNISVKNRATGWPASNRVKNLFSFCATSSKKLFQLESTGHQQMWQDDI